jgi:hypothetical protein
VCPVPYARVAIAAAAAVAAACGAPAGAVAPEAPAVIQVQRRYPAFAFGADARSPGLAVVLGTGPGGEATVITLAPTARAVALEPMANGAAVQVATAPAPDGRGTVRTALRAGGDGGDGAIGWRAAAWTAALAAAGALGKDPGAIAVTAEARGHVDAGAGGLVAAGLIASRVGAAVDPAASVAGVVLPDGTLGPVADVDARIRAALAAGKRRVGVPPGARHRVSGRGRVDRAAEVRQRGGQLLEIGDVRSAYLVMTGRRLPAPVAVAAATMALDAGADEAARAELDSWTAALAPLWATVLELDSVGGVPAVLVDAARAARSAGQAAEVLRGRGQLALARSRLAEAWTYATAAAVTWQVLVAATGGDVDGARTRLAAIGPAAPPIAVPAAAAPTVASALDDVATTQRAITAAAYQRLARDGAVAALGVLDRVAAARPSPRRAGDELARAALPAALAAARAQLAERAAPAAPAAPAAESVRIADGQLEPRAAALRDAAAAILAAVEPTAAPGTTAVARLGLERARAGGVAGLAAAELAALDAWTGLALRASLGAEIDPRTGRAVRVTAAGALPALLTAAERAARGHAAAAVAATGAIPREARLAYLEAHARQHGDLADRVAALAGYWRSSAWSQLAVALARGAAVARAPVAAT